MTQLKITQKTLLSSEKWQPKARNDEHSSKLKLDQTPIYQSTTWALTMCREKICSHPELKVPLSPLTESVNEAMVGFRYRADGYHHRLRRR